jgi:hypothetical protein
MVVLIAIGLALFSFIAGAAGKRGVALAFGVASILTFIYWLQSGPGFTFLDWMDNPTGPELPDSVHIPGRE